MPKYARQEHFVTFLSPGTLVVESSTKWIKYWDTDEAVEIGSYIVERYGARPYAFYFTTRARTEEELDSKEIARSSTYYMGGTIKTLAEVEAEEQDNERKSILLQNMIGNKIDKVIVNEWGNWTMPLHKDDVVLDMDWV